MRADLRTMDVPWSLRGENAQCHGREGGGGVPGSRNSRWICPMTSLLGAFRHTAQPLAQDFKLLFLGDAIGTSLGKRLAVSFIIFKTRRLSGQRGGAEVMMVQGSGL